MIQRLELANFMGFTNLAIDFSPKINVIIGENGTGKTQLLKTAYASCSTGALFKDKPDIFRPEYEAAFTKRLLGLFKPLDDKLGKMHHVGSKEQAKIEAHLFTKDLDLIKAVMTFHNNSQSISIVNTLNFSHYFESPVFVPTKEILSFMKGFASLYDKYELSFDQTYRDLSGLLELPEVRADQLQAKSKWAMDEIEKICGGRFIFYGGGKITFKNAEAEFSANAMAEGFRKAGILSRLLETGNIQPGVSGPLFWDEPETNLNPKLMKMLVGILLELSRGGQQIIIATHDYVLLKWFDLLMDKGKEDHVRFHVLYRNPETKQIQTESIDDYRAITPNAIADTFNDLTIAHARARLRGAQNG